MGTMDLSPVTPDLPAKFPRQLVVNGWSLWWDIDMLSDTFWQYLDEVAMRVITGELKFSHAFYRSFPELRHYSPWTLHALLKRIVDTNMLRLPHYWPHMNDKLLAQAVDYANLLDPHKVLALDLEQSSGIPKSAQTAMDNWKTWHKLDGKMSPADVASREGFTSLLKEWDSRGIMDTATPNKYIWENGKKIEYKPYEPLKEKILPPEGATRPKFYKTRPRLPDDMPEPPAMPKTVPAQKPVPGPSEMTKNFFRQWFHRFKEFLCELRKDFFGPIMPDVVPDGRPPGPQDPKPSPPKGPAGERSKPKPRKPERFPHDPRTKLPPIVEERLGWKFAELKRGFDAMHVFPQLAGLRPEIQAQVLYMLGLPDELAVRIGSRMGEEITINVVKRVARLVAQNVGTILWDMWTALSTLLASIDLVLTSVDIVSTIMMIIDLIPYKMGECNAITQMCEIEPPKHHAGLHQCSHHHSCHFTGDRCGYRPVHPHGTICNWHRREVYQMVTGHGPWKEVWDEIFGKHSDSDTSKWHDKECHRMAKKKRKLCEEEMTLWFYDCLNTLNIDKRSLIDSGRPGQTPKTSVFEKRDKDRHKKACDAYKEANMYRCKNQVEEWQPICEVTRKILIEMEADSPDPSNTMVTRQKPTPTSLWNLGPNITVLEQNATNSLTISFPTITNGTIATVTNTSITTFVAAQTWTASGSVTLTASATPSQTSLEHMLLREVPDRPPRDYCKPRKKSLQHEHCRGIKKKYLHNACQADTEFWYQKCKIRRERGVQLADYEKKGCGHIKKDEEKKCKGKQGKKKHAEKYCDYMAEANYHKCKAQIDEKFSSLPANATRPPSQADLFKVPNWPAHPKSHWCSKEIL
ncbi:Hypothetical protein D9617_6g093590 [Elsinoe fawcettii]|nr:Hypothetical protein D9617_6g093590 [Elsinoe fawcettii]